MADFDSPSSRTTTTQLPVWCGAISSSSRRCRGTRQWLSTETHSPCFCWDSLEPVYCGPRALFFVGCATVLKLGAQVRLEAALAFWLRSGRRRTDCWVLCFLSLSCS